MYKQAVKGKQDKKNTNDQTEFFLRDKNQSRTLLCMMYENQKSYKFRDLDCISLLIDSCILAHFRGWKTPTIHTRPERFRVELQW